MLSHIFLITKYFLNYNDIHTNIVHRPHHFMPLGICHLFYISVPMFSFYFTPMVDTCPSPVNKTGRTNIRLYYFKFLSNFITLFPSSTLRIIRLFPTLSVVFNTYLILCDAPMGSVIVE